MYILQKMGWADQKRGIRTIDQVLVRSGDGRVFPGGMDMEVKDIYIVSTERFSALKLATSSALKRFQPILRQGTLSASQSLLVTQDKSPFLLRYRGNRDLLEEQL